LGNIKRKTITMEQNKELLEKLKTVRTVMVLAHNTGEFFSILKKEVRDAAKKRVLDFYETDKLFNNRRNVIVIC
jgi:uncharacterized protein with ATP-grasp and redox domains